MPEHDSQNADNFNPANFQRPALGEPGVTQNVVSSDPATPGPVTGSADRWETLSHNSGQQIAAQPQGTFSRLPPASIRTAAQVLGPPASVANPSFAPPVELDAESFLPEPNFFNFNDQEIQSQSTVTGNVDAVQSFAPPVDRSKLPFVPRGNTHARTEPGNGISDAQTFQRHVMRATDPSGEPRVDVGVGSKTKLVDLRHQAIRPQPVSDLTTRSAAPSEFLSRDPFSDRFLPTLNSVSESRSSTERPVSSHANEAQGFSVTTSNRTHESPAAVAKRIFLISGSTTETSEKSVSPPKATLLTPTFQPFQPEANNGSPPTKNTSPAPIEHSIPDFILTPPPHVVRMDNPLPPAAENVAPLPSIASTQNDLAKDDTILHEVSVASPEVATALDDTASSRVDVSSDAGPELSEQTSVRPVDVAVKTQRGFTEADFLALEAHQNAADGAPRTSFAGRYVNQINADPAYASGGPFRVANHRRSTIDDSTTAPVTVGQLKSKSDSAVGDRRWESSDQIILPKFRLQQSDFADGAGDSLSTSTAVVVAPHASPGYSAPTHWLSAWWMLVALIPFALYLGTTRLFRDRDQDDIQDDPFDLRQRDQPIGFGSDFGVIGRSKSDAIYGDANGDTIDQDRLESIDQGFMIAPVGESFHRPLFFELPALDQFGDVESAKELSADQSPNFDFKTINDGKPKKKAS